ncbi:hypothetical protein HDU76_002817 [Blyttiomyces sp. JEL0837]|nr:hypothetical protein HDU76_002817 [Blyttiomyces sp. JEL0837]
MMQQNILDRQSPCDVGCFDWFAEVRRLQAEELQNLNGGLMVMTHLNDLKDWMTNDILGTLLLTGFGGHAKLFKTTFYKAQEDPNVDLDSKVLLGWDDFWKSQQPLSEEIAGNCIIAFETAIKNGHSNTVKIWIESGLVDADVGDNNPIKLAASLGHLDVVKVLLEFDSVDPSADNNLALRAACEFGFVEIVKELLAYKQRGVESTVNNNLAFIIACRFGHLNVVKLLVEGDVVGIIKAETYEGFSFAVCFDHLDVLKYLMEVGGVAPDIGNNFAIKTASELGHVEIVRFLLRFGNRVDATVDDNFAVRKAKENGHQDVVDLLLTIPGVTL